MAYDLAVMETVDIVVAIVLYGIATWIVCAAVNSALYWWSARNFVSRKEYEALNAKIDDRRHEQNVHVQGRILAEVEQIKRAANIPPARGQAPGQG